MTSARIKIEVTMETERAEFSISELAREFDITPRAIRFYEDQGCSRRAARPAPHLFAARPHAPQAPLRGKAGPTLSEIRDLIDMYEPGRDERPQLERFLAVLESHKASLLQQQADIEAQLSEIQAFEKKVRAAEALRGH